jgi:asparagine synthase (glutamine-hydrolysing)
MCGIAGVYAYGQSNPGLSHRFLQIMADTMVHRGPDDRGTYLSPDQRLGLAFRRLSIIDLSPAGHQPMCNEDGTVWIVFNGEIYNHAELRLLLEAKGHVYRSRTDTETILHLYEEHDEDCVHHLRGMFAFAIWDERKRRLFLARDRIGIKPLYYTQQSGAFVFGSEIKAILTYPGIERNINLEALYHYLTFMVPPAPLTMFSGIYKLPAGYRMTVDASGTIKQEQYWDAIVPGYSKKEEADEYYAEQIREMLKESIRLRTMSDVPYGVLLSGGIDSSTIVALLADCTNRPINTFSVGFKQYDTYNELQYARQIAKQFKTNHYEVIIDHRDALEYMPQLVRSQDEPIADWVCIPLYFVSKLARDNGVIVVQVGEGSDELFCGYPYYLQSLRRQLLWSYISWVPRSVWETTAEVFQMLERIGIAPARRGRHLLQRLSIEDGLFWGGAIVFRGLEKDTLLDVPLWRSFRQKNGHPDSAKVPYLFYEHLKNRKPAADPLECMIYIELKQRLPELLLMRVDKITMSASIEARVPFLDHRLVEFTISIPMEVKIRDWQTKALLKRAVTGLIPDIIIHRPKQGFSAPVAEWFRNQLADEVKTALLEGQMMKEGYFNTAYVQELIGAHQRGLDNCAVKLWNLYNLEMWYRCWIC